MKIEPALAGATSVFLDTAPIIYYLENNPRYHDVMEAFFRFRTTQGILLVTSPITLSECLVHPVRLGLDLLEKDYHNLIVRGEGTLFQAIGSTEALEAAHIRAAHNLTLADSIQAAVARTTGCQALLTNDPAFQRIASPRAVLLDDLEP